MRCRTCQRICEDPQTRDPETGPIRVTKCWWSVALSPPQQLARFADEFAARLYDAGDTHPHYSAWRASADGSCVEVVHPATSIEHERDHGRDLAGHRPHSHAPDPTGDCGVVRTSRVRTCLNRPLCHGDRREVALRTHGLMAVRADRGR